MTDSTIAGLLRNPERSLTDGLEMAEDAKADGRHMHYVYGMLTQTIKTALKDIENIKELLND